MRFAPLLLALIAAPALATTDDLRSVAGMQFHNRVLLVFAPSLKDGRLIAEQHEMAKAALPAAERDVLLVQVAGGAVLGAHDKAEGLRRKFKVPPPVFKALLLGKDGKVALTSTKPIAAAEMVRVIDAMPMRQEEVRRALAGKGKPAS